MTDLSGETTASAVAGEAFNRPGRIAAYLLLPLGILAAAPLGCAAAGGGDRCVSLTGLVILAYPLWLVYTVPLAIALWRIPEWRPVALVNIMAGWTVVGWVVAFQRALPSSPQRTPSTAEPVSSQAAEWTPQSWSPPPVGYPLPDEPMVVAEPSAPPYVVDGQATEPRGDDEARAQWPAGSPAWVREGSWPKSAVLVRLCGGFEVYSDGERISDGLKAKQAVSYLWLTLLLNDLLSAGRELRRDTFADEMSPGIDNSSQRAQVSNRLHDLGELDPVFSRSVRADKQSIRIDRGSAEAMLLSDLSLLHDLAEAGGRDGRFSDADIGAVERLIEGCKEEALPDWDALDERIANRRGTGGQLIEAVRERQREDLATVTLAAAQTLLETGSPARAAELLRAVLEVKPDREDVARRLVAALTAAGRLKEADTARDEYLA
jgi:hypothetical protein